MSASPIVPIRMQAWACRSYGGPEALELREVAAPHVRSGELLVHVRATTIASADVRIRTLNLPRGLGWLGRAIFGFLRPRQPVLGTDMAGVVTAVGDGVEGFEVGDRVLAMPGAKMGCHAEYRAVRADGAVARIPSRLGFEEAVALAFGGTTALHFLRRSELAAGESILVIGASGAVGSAMVQLARHLGAEVSGVCSGANVELVRGLGASRVVDYERESLSDLEARYDVIADTVAASSFRECLPLLNEGGRYLCIAGGLADMLARPVGSRRSISGPAPERAEDLETLLELAEAGGLRPVIDRVLDWPELPAGHAYAETGRKRGSVVVRTP